MGPLILEVLDQRGRVRQRLRLPRHRLSVGRGYDNDLILDDPWIDPRHLEITTDPDGSRRFADLGSVNGTWSARDGERRAAGPLTPGLELRIGHTVLRVVDPARPVPAARRDLARTPGATALLRRPALGIALAAGGMVLPAITAWLDSAAPVAPSELATPVVAALVAGALWAGGWAVASRAVAHRARFAAHLGWAAAAFLLSSAATFAAGWLGFLWPGTRAVEAVGTAAQLGVAALLIAGHLALVADWPAPRRWRVAGFVVAAGYAATLVVGGSLETEADGAGAYARALRPLSARLVPAQTAEAFFERAAGLEAEVASRIEAGVAGAVE